MTKTSRYAGIGGHHSNRPQTVEWLTPPSIIAALGPFDLDPCAPVDQPYPTAARTFTRRENGLLQRWEGRVRLNPPYTNGEIEKWLGRMGEHGCGSALIFARTETEAFFRHVWERASALLFMRGRINFHLPDGRRADGNAGAPTVLCAYGMHDADVLAACEIDGQFVPLRFPRSVLVAVLADATWMEIVREAVASAGADGPVRVADIWDVVRTDPKAAGKEHARAKVRQVLQRGAGMSIGRDQWIPA
ncbi:DNA N-6-adenine-methyltransferase (Dam) [Bradyrhizobium sp. YR681]|uniref:DNA N-6-adenine-methyltransferase n=1 Tax=Bradyrhizobium sp. YR681 TaxID=1144344 RepID=UPI0002710D33|nr:DNA N-6-adenine-methyltransferase [Bradyrhizobium sp. YR681]EJN11831.1 DNA N-6-adenine-methyltransferase (Dam) [Bradyrhizobium sp. YR681]